MNNKKYIVKTLSPWMIDELLVCADTIEYELILLRKQESFYEDGINELKAKNIEVIIEPFKYNFLFKKLIFVFGFFFRNILKFGFDYNSVIGLKSIIYFMKMDLSSFSEKSNIHAQFATQSTIVALMIKEFFNNKPEYSFTFHAYDIYFNNKWFKLLVNNCYKACSISEYNIEYVNKKYVVSDNIILSRLGVFLDTIKKKDREEVRKSKIFTIGLMTWFYEKKGIHYLLDAMLVLKQKGYDNIKLLLAGDGSLRDEYLEFIKKNKLMNTISYIGAIKREDKPNFFNSLDTFVLPAISVKNDQDGIPVVLMEAIAYSLPIISTNVSGIPEICINDVNGHLIPERNVHELVNSIIFIQENEVKRREYGKNSYSLSKDYDIVINSNKKMKLIGWV